MKIIWTGGIATRCELPFTNQNITAAPGRTILSIEDINPEDELSVFLNDQRVQLAEGRTHCIIPCAFEEDRVTDILIYVNAIRVHIRATASLNPVMSEDVRQDLAHFNYTLEQEMMAHKECMDLADLFTAIREKRIQLLAMNDRMTGLDDKTILEDIRKALPYAEGICTRPRMQLRTRYQVMDIELVKRTTSHSLQHLGAHSEHWKGRTLAGLIPSRMNAITSEDETDIYENIFFGKVMQQAFHIVSIYDFRIKKAIRQTDTLINWDRYGNAFSDFRRTQMLYALLPDYDQDIETLKRDDLNNLLDRIDGLERGLSTVIASKFYRELDRRKIQRFPLPVRPTNILKMDSRYRQILVLWQKILRQQKKKMNRGIGDKRTDTFTNYSNFVSLLLVYALNITGFQITASSQAKLSDDGTLLINAHAMAQDIDRIELHIKTEWLQATPYLRLTFSERQTYHMKYDLPYDIEKIRSYYPDLIEQGGDAHEIVFYRFPDRKRLQSYFSDIKDELEATGNKEIKHQGGILTQLNRQWRSLLEDAIHHMRENRSYTLAVLPITICLHGDAEAIRQTTDQLLVNMKTAKAGTDSILAAIPADLGNPEIYTLKDASIAHRLLNYGEAMLPEDVAFGSYRFGILPISQDDIASAQRLAKIATLHTRRLLMDWGYAQETCPVCGGHHLQHIGDQSYQCLNPSCRTTFGKPRCQHCGKMFDWMQPQGTIKEREKHVSTPIKQMLYLESMLGSMTVTDFAFEDDENGGLRLMPRCPYCGHVSGMQ